MSKQTDRHKEGRKDPAVVLQALRDLVHAVEMAEDNDYSAASRKLLAAAADRASALTWNMPRQTHSGVSAAV
ncbi:MAG: hypothetical protein ABIK08_17660 [Pseudomonadota bacterium]